MREHVDPRVKVKAAGGIRTADAFLDMVRAGAERIGCSAGVPIIEELGRRMAAEGVDTIERSTSSWPGTARRSWATSRTTASSRSSP